MLSWNFNTCNNERTWKHYNKITKVKNGEIVSHLEITEVILVQCNLANNSY